MLNCFLLALQFEERLYYRNNKWILINKIPFLFFSLFFFIFIFKDVLFAALK